MLKRFQYQARAFVHVVAAAVGFSPTADLLPLQSVPTTNWAKVKKYSLAATIATTTFVPVVSEAAIPVPVFSQSAVTITVPVSFQYQSHFRDLTVPAVAEQVTLDKWQQNHPQPQKRKNQNYLSPSVFADPSLLVPDLDGWVPQTSQPLFEKRNHNHLFESYSSDNAQPIPRIDGWLRETSIPKFSKKDIRQTFPSFFFDSYPLPPNEIVTIDKWFVRSEIPRDVARNQYLYPSTFTDIVPPPPPKVSEWMVEAKLPLQKKVRAIQDSFFFEFTPVEAEVVTVDKWFAQVSEPQLRRESRIAQTQSVFHLDYIAQAPENVTLDKWFVEPLLPVRRGYNRAHLSSEIPKAILQITSDVTVDRWFQPTQQPVRKKVGNPSSSVFFVYTDIVTVTNVPVFSQSAVTIVVPVRFQYQSHFRDLTVPVVVENVTVDKWFQPTQQRLNQVKSRRYAYQTITAPLKITVPQILFEVSQPLNQRKEWQHLYPAIARGEFPIPTPEVVNLDKWFSSNNQPYFARRDFSHLYPLWSFDKFFIEEDLGLILGRNNDTLVGVGTRRGTILGRNNDTNIVPGTRSKRMIGYNRDTNTIVGTRRIK